MQINYFGKIKRSHIDDTDREAVREANNWEKYSKGVLYGGVIGLAISAGNYLLTGEPSTQTFQLPPSQLNDTQLIDTVIFGLSTAGYFGGVVMHGLSGFMKRDYITQIKKRIKSDLERELKE